MANRNKLSTAIKDHTRPPSDTSEEEQAAAPDAQRWYSRLVGSRGGRALITIAFGIILLVAWQLIGMSLSPILLSYPTAVAGQAAILIGDGTLGAAFASTLQPFALGYVLGALVGIPLGLFVGRYRMMEAAVGPYITAGYATPLVALLPLFIVWFGIGFTVKVAIVFTLTVFPIVINTWRGVQGVPKTTVEVGTAFGASSGEIMRKIIMPATLPHIMTGLRLGVGRAVIGVIIGEFFTAVSGLGGIIINAANSFQTARMFVPIIGILCWGVIVTRLVGIAEKKLAPWHIAMAGRQQ
ncbi:MAG: ABC transporter permease [Sciscionella sp.]